MGRFQLYRAIDPTFIKKHLKIQRIWKKACDEGVLARLKSTKFQQSSPI
jgi:hypothetical protein